MASKAGPAPADRTGIEEDEGYLDLIDIAVDAIGEVTTITDRIAAALTTLGTQANARTDAMNALRADGRSADVRALKRVINLAAEDLNQFVARLHIELPVFDQQFDVVMRSFGRSLALLPELVVYEGRAEATGEMVPVLEMMRRLRTRIDESEAQMRELRGTVVALPRMTTAFNRAKKQAVSALEDLAESLSAAARLTSESERQIEALLIELVPPAA
jgi:hypothetical protein